MREAAVVVVVVVVVAGPGGPARLSWRPDYRPTIPPGHTTLGYSALLYFILNWYISTDLLEFCMDCNTLYFFFIILECSS